MGAVPLLTREGEVDLARRMERGKLRMQKAISRSALVQLAVVELAEQFAKGAEDLDNVVDLGDVEEGSAADTKAPRRSRQACSPISSAAQEAAAAAGKARGRRRSATRSRARSWLRQVDRAQGGDFAGDPRASRSVCCAWKEFRKEIERAVDELNHLERELKKLEGASSAGQQPRIRELKREIRKREADRRRHRSPI